MAAPLVPARLAFAEDGTPYSQAFGDVYHSADGGPAQARAVFLEGNGLPARWRGRRRFTILELGFGFGLSFLAAWQAWREDPRHCEWLHFVSVELHPFAEQDLAVLHAQYPEFAPLAAELGEAWPMLVPGVHRLVFEGGRVTLTLAFGDATRLLRDLRLAADAIFLDGFAPDRNPEMWSAQTLRAVARLAAPDATAATWSVASAVREALAEAGFAAEKRRGFASKREMLRARLAPRRAAAPERVPRWTDRRAAVIGAGLAGAAVCDALATRGWQVTLIERHEAPAQEASGNLAGVFHPVVTPDDSVFARLTRAGFLAALEQCAHLEAADWNPCGVLQLARDAGEEASQRRAIAALGLPLGYAQWLSAARASRVAGLRLPAGGLWFPEAGWVRPPSLVRALLERCGERLERRFGAEAASLERAPKLWRVRDASGRELAAVPVVVLANAAGAAPLAPLPHVRLRRVRGQVSHLPGERLARLKTVVLRGGFVLPPLEGVALAGASFDLDDEDAAPRAESHAGNLERLERIVPGAARGLDPARLEGRVGFRAVVPDRLPLVGPLAHAAGDGLYGALAYGSRGLVWAALGGELLASRIEGDPLPLEAKLADALDPARFARRMMQRRQMGKA